MFLYPVRKFKFGLYFYKKGSVFIFRGSGFNFLKGDRSKYSSAPGFFFIKGTGFDIFVHPVWINKWTGF